MSQFQESHSVLRGRGRRRGWWSLIRLLPVAGRVAVVAILLNLVIGVLPLGFVIGTSVAIGRVAVERVAVGRVAIGRGSWGAVLLAVGPAVVALLLQSVLAPFQAAFGELISRRVDGECTRRLMRAALVGLDPAHWRSRVAALFQDFHHLELTFRESIGHGDIGRADDTDAIDAAVQKARAERVLRAVPGGLSGYLGHSYADGTELSGGQWQTVALARTLMRRHPLLLILDEPAAALDAAAEHDLFERYATSAGHAGRVDGGITVLISHRFSTVGMADLIAVLNQGLLAEFGTHRDLMAAEGLYAELFTLQARAYR